MRVVPILAFVALVVGSAGDARADDIKTGKVALVRLDSLGMDSERVARLETLFRVEIERLSPSRPPSGREIRKLMATPEHRECGGENACLVAIGKALGADVIVAGNVAALADAFVVNIKALSVASGEEIGRVASEPLRGNPDDLIENVRVAAYRLLAPSKLLGSISVVADIDGASVLLDGKKVATTPLAVPIAKLAVGAHQLEVKADGYKGFTETVEVSFEKTTQVVVSLSGGQPQPLTGLTPVVATRSKPFYKSGWFWATVGIATTAVVVGALIGSQLGKPDIVNCSEDPC